MATTSFSAGNVSVPKGRNGKDPRGMKWRPRFAKAQRMTGSVPGGSMSMRNLREEETGPRITSGGRSAQAS